jgi:prenyltransferase beta subunit
LLGIEIPNKDKLIFWLINRSIDQGVNGRTGKTPDSCYSFWTYASLCLIDKQNLAKQTHIKRFLLTCQCDVV